MYPVAAANWTIVPPPLVPPPLVSTSTSPAGSVSSAVGSCPTVAVPNVYRTVGVARLAAGSSNSSPGPLPTAVEPLPVAVDSSVIPNRLPAASMASAVGNTPVEPSNE